MFQSIWFLCIIELVVTSYAIQGLQYVFLACMQDAIFLVSVLTLLRLVNMSKSSTSKYASISTFPIFFCLCFSSPFFIAIALRFLFIFVDLLQFLLSFLYFYLGKLLTYGYLSSRYVLSSIPFLYELSVSTCRGFFPFYTNCYLKL